jgi:hypothetical protein
VINLRDRRPNTTSLYSFICDSRHVSIRESLCFNLSFSLCFLLFSSFIYFYHRHFFVFLPTFHPSLAIVRCISSRMKWTHLTLCRYQDGPQINETRLHRKQCANCNDYTFQLSKHVQLATLSPKHFGKWDVVDVGSERAADVYKENHQCLRRHKVLPQF